MSDPRVPSKLSPEQERAFAKLKDQGYIITATTKGGEQRVTVTKPTAESRRRAANKDSRQREERDTN